MTGLACSSTFRPAPLHLPSMYGMLGTGRRLRTESIVMEGVVCDHDKSPSPVQACYQRNRSSASLLAGYPGSSSGSLCNPVASPLVAAASTRVGSETRSRHKAYGNELIVGVDHFESVRNEVTP